MAKLPRDLAPHLIAALGALLVAATVASAQTPGEAPPQAASAARSEAKPSEVEQQAASAARSEAKPSEVEQQAASAARSVQSESVDEEGYRAQSAEPGTQAPSDTKPGEAVELIGTWHVLVHYTDDHAADTQAMRWEDRIWVFEPAGSRLRWTDYPIVVFRDKSGRFEALGSNRARRVVHAWEPNDDQRAQIASGLEVNPRGKKTKTLRGSDAKGWHTRARATPASASVITYTENWSIEGMPEHPVFQRVDVLGSGLTEGMDGVTRFTTTEVEPGGRVLRGTFERDGTRHGSFRMTLAGPVGGVQGSQKSEGERVYELFFGEAGAALFGGDGVQALQEKARAGGEVPESDRAELREEIRRALERQLRSRGVDPETYQRETETLAKKIERQIIDEGRSVEEVRRMIEEGEITP